MLPTEETGSACPSPASGIFAGLFLFGDDMKYAQKFKDPRWQKKRLEILERDEWRCQICNDQDSTLHVHHRFYEKGKEPWEYSDSALVTLFEECHETEHSEMPKASEILLRAIMEAGYTSSDIINISLGFVRHKPPQVHEVSACVIESMLADDEVMSVLTERYFSKLKDRREENQ